MPVDITLRLLLKTLAQGVGQINPALIGQTDQYEQYIGHFLTRIGLLFAFLERLLPISTGHDPAKFAHLLVQEDGIGEWVEVSNPGRIDPLIYGILCFLNGHDH